MLACAAAAMAQQPAKPVKFSGEVHLGQPFHKAIGHGLAFILKADDDGWTIDVQPDPPRGESCRNFSTVVAKPLNGYTPNDLSVSYGVSAEEAVKPERLRDVIFVLDEMSCKIEHQLSNRLVWPKDYPPEQVKLAEQRFGSLAGGKAVVKILQSKVSPSGDVVNGKDTGKIDWIKFEVEVSFPADR
jgi:hypothetical protein